MPHRLGMGWRYSEDLEFCLPIDDVTSSTAWDNVLFRPRCIVLCNIHGPNMAKQPFFFRCGICYSSPLPA